MKTAGISCPAVWATAETELMNIYERLVFLINRTIAAKDIIPPDSDIIPAVIPLVKKTNPDFKSETDNAGVTPSQMTAVIITMFERPILMPGISPADRTLSSAERPTEAASARPEAAALAAAD